MADPYRVTSPDDPVLENGNKLCKGKPVVYLLVWKSEAVGNEADPRTFGTVLWAEVQRRFARRLWAPHLRRRNALN
jgi:hypothetical protein